MAEGCENKRMFQNTQRIRTIIIEFIVNACSAK